MAIVRARHAMGRIFLGLGVVFLLSFSTVGKGVLSAESAVGGRFILQDHFGNTVTDRTYQGSFMLVTFGYTFCPDVCPTNLSNMSDAMDVLGDKARQVTPIFITVDPDRDTVKQLRDYVDSFHPRLVGLTGPKAMIDRLATGYKVKYALQKPDKTDDEWYTVDHTASIYLMAPDGRFLVKFAHGMDPEKMARRILDFL